MAAGDIINHFGEIELHDTTFGVNRIGRGIVWLTKPQAAIAERFGWAQIEGSESFTDDGLPLVKVVR